VDDFQEVLVCYNFCFCSGSSFGCSGVEIELQAALGWFIAWSRFALAGISEVKFESLGRWLLAIDLKEILWFLLVLICIGDT